jgi:hypothetical protein
MAEMELMHTKSVKSDIQNDFTAVRPPLPKIKIPRQETPMKAHSRQGINVQ